MAGSSLGAERSSLTARGLNRAVAFFEITFCQLYAGMTAGSHLGSIRSSLTALGLNRAVDCIEITFVLLLAKIWHKQVLPSPIIKIEKLDCFWTAIFFGVNS